ncbi:MAG: hypothetical protein HOI49_11480 [Bacteroidetes bacterium]|jgi:hypothetical protein|nr:hypothetical protein [Bacteroidota bacterium]
MKKILIPFIAVLLVVGCKDKVTETHADNHTSFITFLVSDNADIGSFNVYLDDNIIGQISSSGRDTLAKYSFRHDDITQHPTSLNYTIEPMFYDSASADVDISVFLTVDEVRVAETPTQNIKYNQTISLSHTVE